MLDCNQQINRREWPQKRKKKTFKFANEDRQSAIKRIIPEKELFG